VLNHSFGVIDSDYRGEWMAIFTSIYGAPFLNEYQPFPYKIGERVAQIYFEKVLDVEFEEVEHLDSSERGEGGFGSTGVF